MKNLIRLTEGDLHRIIEKSVNKVLKEDEGPYFRPNEPFDINTSLLERLKRIDNELSKVDNNKNWRIFVNQNFGLDDPVENARYELADIINELPNLQFPQQ